MSTFTVHLCVVTPNGAVTIAILVQGSSAWAVEQAVKTLYPSVDMLWVEEVPV